jgi:deoxyribonuclease V
MAQRTPARHRWDVSVEEAIALQERLRPLVQQAPAVALDRIRTVAGVDGAYDEAGWGRAAVVVHALPDLEVVEQAIAVKEVSFPHVPGLLSFREGPVVPAAVERLKTLPAS